MDLYLSKIKYIIMTSFIIILMTKSWKDSFGAKFNLYFYFLIFKLFISINSLVILISWKLIFKLNSMEKKFNSF